MRSPTERQMRCFDRPSVSRRGEPGGGDRGPRRTRNASRSGRAGPAHRGFPSPVTLTRSPGRSPSTDRVGLSAVPPRSASRVRPRCDDVMSTLPGVTVEGRARRQRNGDDAGERSADGLIGRRRRQNDGRGCRTAREQPRCDDTRREVAGEAGDRPVQPRNAATPDGEHECQSSGTGNSIRKRHDLSGGSGRLQGFRPRVHPTRAPTRPTTAIHDMKAAREISPGPLAPIKRKTQPADGAVAA